MSIDNWDPNNKRASFRRIAEGLMAQARALFLKDKTHLELFFFVKADGEAFVMPAPPQMDRAEMAQKLKELIREEKVYGVVHIAEGWAYFPKGPDDHTQKQIALGEIKVSELNPQDRREALIVNFESRDGDHRIWAMPVVREQNEVRLADPITFDHPARGRLGGLFEGTG